MYIVKVQLYFATLITAHADAKMNNNDNCSRRHSPLYEQYRPLNNGCSIKILWSFPWRKMWSALRTEDVNTLQIKYILYLSYCLLQITMVLLPNSLAMHSHYSFQNIFDIFIEDVYSFVRFHHCIVVSSYLEIKLSLCRYYTAIE